MKVETIEVSKQEVKTELAALKKGIKEGYLSKRSGLTRDLLSVYGHLRYGGAIIDIFKTMEKTGLKNDDCPNLAVVQANAKHCFLWKKKSGGAIFSVGAKGWYDTKTLKEDVELPPETFSWQDLENRCFKTIAPLIPPRILVEVSARIIPYHYYIIFEAEEWVKTRPKSPPRDPILCKRLTKNLFGVLATWDLTELERNIIRGRV
ncbi:hypothetical protein ES702_02578 [subsurface metagenome]